MNETRYIANAYSFANGMVMVFDQFGEQMPDFQGRLSEMEPLIRANFKGPIEPRQWRNDLGPTSTRDTLERHSMFVESQRIRAAQIITDGLVHLSHQEMGAVLSLVLADMLDRIALSDGDKARHVLDVVAGTALHVWGMANGVDHPLPKGDF